MKDVLGVLWAIALSVGCLVSISYSKTMERNKTAAAETSNQVQASPDLHFQREQAEQQARPEVEKQRKQAEDEARKSLDQDAKTAIAQTRKAVEALSKNKIDDALSDIEQATGKINMLLARNPNTELIPVDLAVEVIDTAPRDNATVLEIAQDASLAFDEKNYPTARALLFMLMSEIRVRTYHLPLSTYPDALKQAARLLDQKKRQDASNILLTALNTLVVVDRVTPLPLVLARDAINQAQEKSKQDKQAAQALLETARNEIERARELGYTGEDQEYAALNDQISTLERQLKGKEDTLAAFSKLKDKLGAILRRQSQEKRG